MTARPYERLNRPGWLTFAAIVMFAVGIVRFISALYFFANSTRIENVRAGAFGNHLFIWGLWDLIIAVIAFFAGISLLNGGKFGRVGANIWAIVATVQSFLLVAFAPWYGFATMIFAGLVVFALAATDE